MVSMTRASMLTSSTGRNWRWNRGASRLNYLPCIMSASQIDPRASIIFAKIHYRFCSELVQLRRRNGSWDHQSWSTIGLEFPVVRFNANSQGHKGLHIVFGEPATARCSHTKPVGDDRKFSDLPPTITAKTGIRKPGKAVWDPRGFQLDTR